jgi:hypothetical protein
MDQATPSTASANTLHCALELSKKSWLLAIQFPDREQPSLYPIAGGDAGGWRLGRWSRCKLRVSRPRTRNQRAWTSSVSPSMGAHCKHNSCN